MSIVLPKKPMVLVEEVVSVEAVEEIVVVSVEAVVVASVVAVEVAVEAEEVMRA